MIMKIPNCSPNVLLLFYLVVVLFPAITSVITAFSLANETDYHSLLALKGQIASDPSDTLSSWNDSIHFCGWAGVTCGKKHRRVTALNLSSLQLVGSLSPNIGNLTFLRVLCLDDNSFKGMLPHELSRLKRLQKLHLSNNSFEGELPKNLTNLVDLKILYLDGNSLGGLIPHELGSLMKLTRLILSRNRFTGEVPPTVGNLSALTYLHLGENHIQGSIPPQLGYLSKMELLSLGRNNLSGHIPSSLYNISSVLYFSLVRNNLKGSLPSNLFLDLPKLKNLLFGSNKLSGFIPGTITNASRAVKIDLSDNALVGPVPVDLGGLKKLQVLSLGENYLGTKDGDDLSFITSLINCTDLGFLYLSVNRLKGVLPDSITNLSAPLTKLSLDRNILSGTIPSGIGKLVNLQLLKLSENMLTGSIPSSIGKLSKLVYLGLFHNNLSGVIPSSLGNLTSLSYLYLQNAMLEGTIPASLGNCTNLNDLVLDENRLVGVVPQELFGLSSLTSCLSFPGNYLTGPIPSRVGKLVNLLRLHVSENNMLGELPSTLGQCRMLEVLDLEGNQFNGTIPLLLSNLRSLKVLDLSRNHFSGHIPGFLADLPYIESLNLSFNMLEGEVPNRGIFRNLSAVSIVGNDELCGGPPSLNLRKCNGGATKKDSKTQKRVLVITVPISVACMLVGFVAVILYRMKRSKSGTAIASSTQEHHPKLSYGELSRATDGFSPTNMIGEGSFGAVYKGILPSNGQIVAVKVIKIEEVGGSKSFMAECEALKNIRHRNLIKTITACSAVDFRGEDFKALVFEFMANGSLERWLHPDQNEIGESKQDTRLSVAQRLNIAIDVAEAVDYLHYQCHAPVAHSDLKPSNVLLDSDFSARVSDFGLAKFLVVNASGTESSSIGIRGTIGYVAPEYGVGGKVSTQGDTYSFGILLLELFTGKRPTDSTFSGELGLRGFVQGSLPDGLNQVLDPLLLLGEVQPEGNLLNCLLTVLNVGLMCSAPHPDERMGIGDAVAELQKARNSSKIAGGEIERERFVVDV